MRYPKFQKSLLIMVIISQIFVSSASALSQAQHDVFHTGTPGIPYFNIDEGDVCSGGNNGTDTATTVNGVAGSTWTSGEQPPYYLENYVTNILKDVAKRLNVPEANAVTQEHVLALVAWTYAEGGNIANSGAYNIWNTGLLSRPDLVDGRTNASGVQSFMSFDAGVEANAISLTQSNQNRIGKIVTQPTSTAAQVMHTIAYYDETTGDKAWAWGPDSNSPSAVLQFNHTTYVNSLLNTLASTQKDYANRASVVLGPGEKNTHHVDPTKLVFKSTVDTGGAVVAGAGTAGVSGGCPASSGGLSPECKTAVGNARILCAAKVYDTVSYLEVGAAGHQGGAAWHQTCQTVGPSCILDCSGLVNIAIYDVYGADLKDNTTSERTDTTNLKPVQFSDLKPGDLIQPNSGHVEIVDHIVNDTIFTFGSHSANRPQPDQVGPAQFKNDGGNLYLRYIGKGATAS